ncbi:MAG: tape measure protein [Sphingobium sp.]
MAKSVIGALRVTLGLDSAEFETGIKRASKSSQQFSKSAKELGAGAASVSTALRGVGAAIGITSLGAGAAAYLKLADTAKQLAAQLKLATANFGSFGQAQEDVNRIASVTRNGLSETASLYANFMRATKEMGGQQWEAARATETFSKTLKISGASQAEAASATLQFGQALAAGALRGDELNSILEASPRLSRLLADSLGVSVDSLREMGKEGALTSDRLFRALTDKKFTASIDAEFKEMPVTFDEAMQQVHNAAIVSFGAFDRGGQFSTMIANFVTDGADGFDDMATAAERFGVEVREQFNAASEAVRPFLEFLREIRDLLGYVENSVPKGAKMSPYSLAGTTDIVTSLWRAPQAVGRGAYAALNGGSFSGEFSDFMARTSAKQLVLNTQGNIDSANAQLALDRIMQGNPLRDAPQVPTKLKPSAAGGKEDKATQRAADAARRKAQREAERAARALRQFTDTVARENADITSALAELVGTTEAKRDADMQQIDTDREIRARAINADDQLDDARKQQLLLLNDENADTQKALVQQRAQEEIDQRNLQIDQDRAALAIEMLGYASDAARTAKERRDVELRILDAQFEAERQALLVAEASEDLAEATRARERLAALPQIQAGARDQVMRQTQGPLESYLDRLPRTADDAREALERVQVDGIDGLIDGLTDAATGVRSLGDVFKRISQQIIADLIRIQIQKAIVGGLSNILGGGTIGVPSSGIGGSITTALGNGSSLAANLKIPEFNTGGSFKVGGVPGIDKNLIAFKATRGEMVDIRRPGNDNGAAPVYQFDLRGAVMTADLVAQMNRIGQTAAVGGALAGSQQAQSSLARRSRNRIP